MTTTLTVKFTDGTIHRSSHADDEGAMNMLAPMVITRKADILMADINPYGSATTNMWGTLRADIDPAEYCQECEQRTDLGHYDTCPTRVGTPTPQAGA